MSKLGQYLFRRLPHFCGVVGRQAVLLGLDQHFRPTGKHNLIQNLIQRLAEHATQSNVTQRLMEKHLHHMPRGIKLVCDQVDLAAIDEPLWCAGGPKRHLLLVVGAHAGRNGLVIHALGHHDVGSVLPCGADGVNDGRDAGSRQAGGKSGSAGQCWRLAVFALGFISHSGRILLGICAVGQYVLHFIQSGIGRVQLVGKLEFLLHCLPVGGYVFLGAGQVLFGVSGVGILQAFDFGGQLVHHGAQRGSQHRHGLSRLVLFRANVATQHHSLGFARIGNRHRQVDIVAVEPAIVTTDRHPETIH